MKWNDHLPTSWDDAGDHPPRVEREELIGREVGDVFALHTPDGDRLAYSSTPVDVAR